MLISQNYQSHKKKTNKNKTSEYTSKTVCENVFSTIENRVLRFRFIYLGGG